MAQEEGGQEEVMSVLLEADSLLRRERAEQAVALYKKANDKSGGKCAECLAGMAAGFNQMKAYKSAVEAAQKLIDLNASKEMNLRGYKELGTAHMQRSMDDAESLAAAEQAFRKALEISEGRWNDGRYALGVVLVRQKRDDEAIAVLKEFVQRDPRDSNAPHANQIISRPACGREACVPDFSLVTTDGDYITQENLKGKVTLLHFWTVWEGWEDEMWPGMKRLAMWTKKKDSPVQVIGISSTRDEGRSRTFIQGHGMTWPQCIIDTYRMTQAFQVRTFPTQIVVNHEGMVVYRHLNWSSDQADLVNQAISIAVNDLKKAQKAEAKTKEEKKD